MTLTLKFALFPFFTNRNQPLQIKKQPLLRDLYQLKYIQLNQNKKISETTMSFLDLEGWESPKHEYRVQSDRIMITKCKQEVAKTILKQTRHSLEPDMALGWKPKLPSCPLPLSYFNAYNQQLMAHIPKDDRFKIVYLGKRSLNSVQVNQQYSYFWRYRQRYSLNIAIIQEAVKSVGNNHLNISKQISKALTQKQLSFDSSFQSGNLQMAVKVKPNEYDLYLRSDTNTKGHTNWYYFKVNNKDFVGTSQFNICNIGKTKTLYNKGMKPYVFQVNSENNLQSKSFKQKWSQQRTFDVCLVERYCRYGFDKKTFQLQFKYHFKKPNTEIYLAYGVPYTYSQLQEFIKEITENHPKILKCQKMCESLGGLNLPLITISSEQFLQKNQQIDQRAGLDVNFSDNLLNKGQIPLEQNKKKKGCTDNSKNTSRRVKRFLCPVRICQTASSGQLNFQKDEIDVCVLHCTYAQSRRSGHRKFQDELQRKGSQQTVQQTQQIDLS